MGMNRPIPGRSIKREFEMNTQLSRTLIAIAAALAMSTVTVGAAVGPAQALANPVNTSAQA
jgi:hypothetical protein